MIAMGIIRSIKHFLKKIDVNKKSNIRYGGNFNDGQYAKRWVINFAINGDAT